MTKRSLYPPLLLIGLVGLDLLSKHLALKSGLFWSNSGVLLGFLNHLPGFLLVTALGALSAFLFLIYVCLMLFLHPRLLGLKLGLSFLASGIFGNVLDKAIRGWTLDWITLPWWGGKFIAFNLADTFLWIGITTVLWWVFRRDTELWYPGDQRRSIWHSPREQLWFSLKFSGITVGTCGMVGIFSFAFIRQILLPFPGELGQIFGTQYILVLACLTLLLAGVSFIIGLWLSHRMLGPVRAFERHVEEIVAGKQREFKLREGDMLKRLEEIAQLIGKTLCVWGLLTLPVWAYPQFIGMQYTSCLTCHFNPMGSGAINDYGRGVAATGVAGRLGDADSVSEEDLVARSSFPGIDPQKNTWLRPFIGYRGLGLDRGAFSGRSEKSWINMQLDANLVVKGGARDQYIASFTIGTRPVDPAQAQNLLESKSYSREHYVGWRPTQAVGVYVGKMDKVFGLRIPDHNLSSRRSPGVAQFNQVHGVMVHAVGEKLEGAAHYFVGDLNETDEALRDKGMSGMLEWGVTERQRLGASYLVSENDSGTTAAMALHDRVGFGKGHSVMAEVGEVRRRPTVGNELTSRYGLLQTHLLWLRGLFITGTFDYFQRDTSAQDETFGVGPGIQWFPRQKVEVRVDVLNRRIFSESQVPEDSWQVLAQGHLWL